MYIENVETERLAIRRFVEGDLSDLHEYLSQEEVVRFEPYELHTREQAEAELSRRIIDPGYFAVCLKDGGKLIGNIYLREKELYRTWELGYAFNTKYHGRGYATEAARALIGEAFRNHNAHRVAALCNPLNTASWRLMERLGMRREGHLIQNIFFKRDENGQPVWADTYEYAILADEWRERRNP